MLHTTIKTLARSFGAAAMFAVLAAPGMYAQEAIKADIPFAFSAGSKALPAGAYFFRIDRQLETIFIEGPQSALEPYVTTLAAVPHSQAKDAHIVFDKVGGAYTLSELWEPGGNGFLVHATKGPHEHHVIHVNMKHT